MKWAQLVALATRPFYARIRGAPRRGVRKRLRLVTRGSRGGRIAAAPMRRNTALRLSSEAGSFDVVAESDRVVRLRGVYEAINRDDLEVLADWFPRGFE
jgi:hypothetical protein